MAATRLLTMSKTLSPALSNETLSMASTPRTLICLNKSVLSSDNPPTGGGGGGERKPVVVKAAGSSPASVLVSEPKTEKGVDLGLLMAVVADVMSHWRKFIAKPRSWGLHIQMFVEKGIIDCRFFTLLAVAGSLLSSVLCFVEGSLLIAVSYLQYFHSIAQVMSEQGHVMLQLIEAIDMFVMGTAMLVFAISLHVMFVRSYQSDSTLSENIKLKKVASWMGMESATQAKGKIGQAIILILHVQVLDKFKSIAVSNGMDLACFAAAILLSSASIYLLSRISIQR